MELGFCSAILAQGLSSELHNLTEINGCWKQNENWTQPADHHNTTLSFAVPLESTESAFLALLKLLLTQESFRPQSNPDEFPFNLDMNSGSHLGIGMHNPQHNRISYISQVGCRQRSARVEEAARQLRIWDHNSFRAAI